MSEDEFLFIKLKIEVMKKNMGSLDKVIRIVIALVFLFLYFTQVVSATLGVILIALSVIFALTSLISFCPIYLPFGINTSKKK